MMVSTRWCKSVSNGEFYNLHIQLQAAMINPSVDMYGRPPAITDPRRPMQRPVL